MAAELALTPLEEMLSGNLPDGAALDAMRTKGLPTKRVEAWKWSDLRRASQHVVGLSHVYQGSVPPAPMAMPDPGVTIGNGQIIDHLPLPDGVRMSIDTGAEQNSGRDIPGVLAGALPTYRLSLPDGETSMSLRRVSDGDGYHADSVLLVVPDGATLILFETHEMSGSPFSNSLTRVELGAGATLHRVLLSPIHEGGVNVGCTEILCDQGAVVRQHTLAFGGKFSRLETDVICDGTSDVVLNALYRLADHRHLDLTSRVQHSAPGTCTRQLVKGVAEDKATAIFQGKFLVERSAQQTDAQMAHHAMLLNDGASVNAKPELEIYADDVECAHGNTAGALDPEALFYLRQRGLTAPQARQMLIDAFGGEVLDAIEDEGTRTRFAELFAAGGR